MVEKAIQDGNHKALEGAQSQLQGEADAQASTVRQEVEDDVVNAKQRDEEKG